MLKITNIGVKQATSYYNKDGYYARVDDLENEWVGNLKTALGMPNQIIPEDFNEIIKEIEAKVDYKDKNCRAGFDMCFSAPKSVSVAMAGDDKTKNDMIAAHNQAVDAMIKKIESEEIGTRITSKKKTIPVKTGNMLAGKFNHYVSRANDPQLHTHVVVLNKTMYRGKEYAIDNKSLMKNQAMYGQLYRNALAAELMKMGYQIKVSNIEKGYFELAGVPGETLDHFSTRRKEIEKQVQKWKTSTDVDGERAALLTRKAKQNKDLKVLMESWQQSIHDLGGLQIKKGESIYSDSQVAFDKAVEMMTRKQFAFTENDMRRVALACGVETGMNKDQFETFFRKEIGGKITCLGRQRSDQVDSQTYYCTQKSYQVEQEIFAEVAKSKNSMEAMDLEQAKAVLSKVATDDKGNLCVSEQQRDAILFLATQKDRFSAIQGLAGTGKTYMANYAREVLEDAGYVVKGACFTGKAASGLRKDANIPSVTLHRFLNTLEKEAGNFDPHQDFREKSGWNLAGLKPSDQKEIWIVDEASMADNIAIRSLVEAAELKNAKVCFMGDKQQLLPVGVGNAFSNLVEKQKMEVVTLDDIRRQQKNQKLLESVKNAVIGGPDGAIKSFEMLENDKSVCVIEDSKKRLQAITKNFVSLSQDERESTVVLTAGNQERKELNKQIHKMLKDSNQLQDGITFEVQNADGITYKREFSVSDKVIFLKNDTRIGVENGQTGFVEAVTPDQIRIRCGKPERPDLITINPQEYNYIDHGYALTSHKAQGITEGRALIHLDSSQENLNSRNSYYVDISRAQYEVKIYTDNVAKIKGQIKEFAKKLTLDDFEPNHIPRPKTSAENKEFGLNQFDQMHKSMANEIAKNRVMETEELDQLMKISKEKKIESHGMKGMGR